MTCEVNSRATKVVLESGLSVGGPSSSYEMIVFCDSGLGEKFSAHILISNIQVVSDPYDIKMGDPRAGESVADYDKYVSTSDSSDSRLFYLFVVLPSTTNYKGK